MKCASDGCNRDAARGGGRFCCKCCQWQTWALEILTTWNLHGRNCGGPMVGPRKKPIVIPAMKAMKAMKNSVPSMKAMKKALKKPASMKKYAK